MSINATLTYLFHVELNVTELHSMIMMREKYLINNIKPEILYSLQTLLPIHFYNRFSGCVLLATTYKDENGFTEIKNRKFVDGKCRNKKK